MKKVKTSLSVWGSRMLILSGMFQSMVITTHINMMTNLYSTLIGFYMFAFVLFTIINILNGVNFAAKKSLVTLITTYIVSIIQCVFAALFVNTALYEVKMIEDVTLTKGMIMSFSYMGVSVALSIIALICVTVFQVKKQKDISIYF